MKNRETTVSRRFRVELRQMESDKLARSGGRVHATVRSFAKALESSWATDVGYGARHFAYTLPEEVAASAGQHKLILTLAIAFIAGLS